MDKPIAQMPPVPRAPKIAPPDGACDAHVHLVGGRSDFPLWDGRVEDPARDESGGPDFQGWLDLYRAHLDTLGFDKGLIVHSILYGTDNKVTIETLKHLGPNFKGVGLLPDTATDADLDRFADQNLVAVRLNYVHGGVLTWDGARAMAPRLAARNLHIQMLLHSHLHIADLAPDIRALPVPLVIDHIGWPDLSLGTDDPGFQTLLKLVGDGHAYIKLSALYRLCPAPYDDAAPFVEALARANPDRCLWGSDWPHLMLNGAAMPHAASLLDAFHDTVTDTDSHTRILKGTPDALFFG
ncbi:amidohydrolase family protein [Pseudooctadecabacter jejudonensis]|uniref:2-pyrone-4,6-dicarbaxylate hydrolase n=1 Tax=Pseudooctadecabacter jejudonensis TaxID=1391910 RepID=A0A1Y5RR26_9RHOB|nr:amidohydrolase family protein [Pseudooctadecabacter jejudonensis]SLN22362.1 2-pyrone-4,6-dicarbaxylate hydrolase [Pseudooctadecabacter jejudonensis]